MFGTRFVDYDLNVICNELIAIQFKKEIKKISFISSEHDHSYAPLRYPPTAQEGSKVDRSAVILPSEREILLLQYYNHECCFTSREPINLCTVAHSSTILCGRATVAPTRIQHAANREHCW